MTVWDHLRLDATARTPLAAQLSQQIRLLVASNLLQPGDVLPSVRQLGARLGISFHTVRAAYQQLESEGLVSTRQGVGTTVLDVGMAALNRPGTASPSFTIGVIIPAYSDFYGPLLQGIHDGIRHDPTLLFICDSQENPNLAERYLDQLVAHGVDGIILVAREAGDRETFTHNRRLIPPLVSVDIPAYPPPRLLFDLRGGAHAAADHILQHGHRRVGLICPPRTWSNVAEIVMGYETAFADYGLALSPDLVAEVPDFTLESGRMGMRQLLLADPPPSAVLAAGDLLAVGALREAKARGRRVPDDIALMGFDDGPLADLTEPPLTTVYLPTHEMGRQAYDALRRIMAGVVEPELVDHLLPSRLLIRQSCGCPPQASLS